MRKICSANPDWKKRFFFLNNYKYSNGPSEIIVVLGFEIAANFGDCTIINRQQRLAPFHSMPKPQKSKWGNDIRNMHRNCVMQLPLLRSYSISPPPLSTAWCSFLSSLICSSPLLYISPSAALLRVMQLPLSPLQLSSPPPSSLHCVMQLPLLCSSPLHRSPLHDAAFSLLQLSSISPLPSLSSPPSAPWCSFLPHLQLSSI